MRQPFEPDVVFVPLSRGAADELTVAAATGRPASAPAIVTPATALPAGVIPPDLTGRLQTRLQTATAEGRPTLCHFASSMHWASVITSLLWTS